MAQFTLEDFRSNAPDRPRFSLGPLSDAQFYRDISTNIMDTLHGVSRGMSADLLGSVADLGAQVMTVPRYLGAGTPDFTASPVGGSEMIGRYLEQAGLLRPRTGSAGETAGRVVGGLLTAPRAVGAVGGAAEGAVRQAITNAQAPGLSSGQFGRQVGAAAGDVSRSRHKIGTTGQIIGAPKGVTSHQKETAIVNDYVDAIERSLKAGVRPGYFYEQGTDAIRAVTDSPADALVLGKANAITSSEAPVSQNFGWSVKGIEQNAMGLPIRTGKYPVEASKTLEEVVAGGSPYLGHKRERYGAGLTGSGSDSSAMAPNDRWELRSVGHGDTASPTQHAWVDRIRQKAVEKINEKLGLNLTPLEAQELHWAAVRADSMGELPHVGAADTVQGSIPFYTMQHSWESAPGASARNLMDLPREELPALHEQMKGALLDPSGKDTLIRAMGGKMQRPAFDAPGVYEGSVSPGTQSRSLVYHAGGEMDPSSAARVRATEGLRALFLGQEAAGGGTVVPAKTIKGTDTAVVSTGRPFDAQSALALQQELDAMFGPGTTALVPMESGVRILDTGAQDFGKAIAGPAGDRIRALLGQDVTVDASTRVGGIIPGERGLYETLPWQQGRATEHVLGMLDNPAAPALPRLADSPETRAVAQRVLGVFEERAAQGYQTNPQLLNMLKTYATEGLAGVQRLVQQGLAPAVALTWLASQLGQPQDGQAQ